VRTTSVAGDKFGAGGLGRKSAHRGGDGGRDQRERADAAPLEPDDERAFGIAALDPAMVIHPRSVSEHHVGPAELRRNLHPIGARRDERTGARDGDGTMLSELLRGGIRRGGARFYGRGERDGTERGDGEEGAEKRGVGFHWVDALRLG
jgi:hypothetical protein